MTPVLRSSLVSSSRFPKKSSDGDPSRALARWSVWAGPHDLHIARSRSRPSRSTARPRDLHNLLQSAPLAMPHRAHCSRATCVRSLLAARIVVSARQGCAAKPRQLHIATISGDDRIVQIRGRVEVVQLARLEDCVEPRRDFGAATRLRSVVVVVADDGATYSSRRPGLPGAREVTRVLLAFRSTEQALHASSRPLSVRLRAGTLAVGISGPRKTQRLPRRPPPDRVASSP